MDRAAGVGVTRETGGNELALLAGVSTDFGSVAADGDRGRGEEPRFGC